MIRRIALCLLLSLAVLHSAAAQVASGVYTFGAFDSKGPDTINVGNLNVHLGLPVLNKAGRGLPFYYDLSYDSYIWYPASVNGVLTWTPVLNFGWRGDTEVSTGYISFVTSTSTVRGGAGGVCSTTTRSGWVYHDAFGAAHPFTGITITYIGGCTGTSRPSFSSPASDVSGYTLNVVNGGQATLVSKSGETITAPELSTTGSASLVDSNGNEVSVDGSGNFTDTTGQVVLQIAGSAPNAHTFTYKDTTGTGQAVSMTYKTYTVQTAFGCGSVGEYGPTSTSLVDRITYPDGSFYQFTYEATPGQSGSVTGRLAAVTVPSGGTIQYAYTGTNNGINCVDGSNWGLQRTATNNGSATTARYVRSTTNGSGSSHTAVTDALGNSFDYDFMTPGAGSGTSAPPELGLLYEVNHNAWNGSASGLHVFSQQTCYNNSGPQCLSTAITLPIAQVDTFQQYTDMGQAGTRTLYNTTYGEINEIDTYDYGKPYQQGTDNRGAVLTKELFAYGQNGAPANLLSSDSLTSNGTQGALTTYAYDQTTPVPSSGVPSHVAASGPRGNLTSVTAYAASGTSYTTTNTYEDTGTLLSSTDPVNGKSSISYDGTFTYPTGSTLPTPSSGVAMQLGGGFDMGNTGLPTSSTDVNGRTTYYKSYDALLRPTEIDFPDGGKTTSSYTPTNISTHVLQSASQSMDAETLLDGYGRTIRVGVSTGAGQWYLADTCYDGNGRTIFQSYPYQSSSLSSSQVCSGAGDSLAYDAIGRQTQVQHGDGTKQTVTYTGRAKQTVDESGVTRIAQVDGLGRPTIVCEISSNTLAGLSPSSCGTDIAGSGYLTIYSYNIVNNQISIAQGAQYRTFESDWLGRPILTTEPERGTTTYSYSSNSTGLIVARMRPQANQTSANVLTTSTTQYDVLGRPLSIAYNDNLTPTRTFMYDQTGAFGGGTSLGFSKGRLTRELSSAGNGTGEAIGYDSMGRVTALYHCRPSICGNGADATLFTYDLAGNMLTSTDGNNVTTTYTYSAANQMQTATSSRSDAQDPAALISNVQNGPFGPVNYHLGNGLSAVNTYDGLGRLNGRWVCAGNTTSAGCSGGTQLDGSSVSWRGVQATGMTDAYANTSYTYGYDEFNRLKSTAVGNTTTYTYAYDRWGNRTSQTPGPSISYNTSLSNNHMVGFAYDAAGNLLTDAAGLNYTYDAEGNVLRVTGTSQGTIQFTYDGLNRRVRVDKGSTFQEYDFNSAGQRVSIWNGTTNVQGQYYLDGQTAAYYTGGSIHFQHKDWLGTERMRTTATGAVEGRYTQLAFGDGYTANGTDSDDAHYASLDMDAASGTLHAMFRELDTTHGRWMSPDPYDGSYNVFNPQSLNRYTYVLNQPVSATDVSGEDDDGNDPSAGCYDNGDPGGGDPTGNDPTGNDPTGNDPTGDNPAGNPPTSGGPSTPALPVVLQSAYVYDFAPPNLDLIYNSLYPVGLLPLNVSVGTAPNNGEPPSPCLVANINAVNSVSNLNVNMSNVVGQPFIFNGGLDVNFAVPGGSPSQLPTGRYPSSFLNRVFGIGSSLHVPAFGGADPSTYGMSNGNFTFTTHIDSAYSTPFTPLGALIHFFVDVRDKGAHRKPC